MFVQEKEIQFDAQYQVKFLNKIDQVLNLVMEGQDRRMNNILLVESDDKFIEDHGLVEKVASTSKGNTIIPIGQYRHKKEGPMYDIGRRCAGCYTKERAQQSREASYAAAK